MATKFCSYHFTTGCTNGDACTFSHEHVIPRRYVKCNKVHISLYEQSLCVYMHEGEVWNMSMPPIVHPSYHLAERELTLLKKALAESEKARIKAVADLADADHLADLRDKLEEENGPPSPRNYLTHLWK